MVTFPFARLSHLKMPVHSSISSCILGVLLRVTSWTLPILTLPVPPNVQLNDLMVSNSFSAWPMPSFSSLPSTLPAGNFATAVSNSWSAQALLADEAPQPILLVLLGIMVHRWKCLLVGGLTGFYLSH